jgi:O-methyltransferase
MNDKSNSSNIVVNPHVGFRLRVENLEVRARNLSFLNDKKFMKIFNNLVESDKDKGKVWRLHIFLWCFSSALKREGDLIECGVFRGLSSALACQYTSFDSFNKNLYLFDTWDGIPEDQIDKGRSTNDYFNKKYMDESNLEKVYERFSSYTNVKIIKGKVPDIFNSIELPKKISFLHLDMNNSLAEIGALEAVFENLVDGAMCLLDDYGMSIAREQMLSESDWFQKKGYLICDLPTGQGLVIKNKK